LVDPFVKEEERGRFLNEGEGGGIEEEEGGGGWEAGASLEVEALGADSSASGDPNLVYLAMTRRAMDRRGRRSRRSVLKRVAEG